jgi:hypothetical protein
VSGTRRELLAMLAGGSPPSDAEQLNLLLEVELGLQAAYSDALERDLIDRALGELLLRHEREHVRGLKQLVRGPTQAPAPPPQADNRRGFAEAALRLEAAGVAAYTQALTTLRNDRLLQPLGSIMACGAQHEVALRNLLGDKLL